MASFISTVIEINMCKRFKTFQGKEKLERKKTEKNRKILEKKTKLSKVHELIE